MKITIGEKNIQLKTAKQMPKNKKHKTSEEVENYLNKIPEVRLEKFNLIRETMIKNLPHGFSEVINYGMLCYVVPHSIYPQGYHCNPKLPLPFISLASQKNFIALYHMGLYADEKLLKWFQDAWKKTSSSKLDMGKSCIRFKEKDQIPMELLEELMTKISVSDWIKIYEANFKSSVNKK